MPGRSQGRSQRTAATPSSTDRTDRTVSSTFESADVWDGGQVQRTPWFFKKLHKLQETFKFKLFCVSACVSIPNKGQIAVYSVEHAKAHRNGELKGTIKDPCMWVPATTSAPVVAPSSTPSHGGYPGTPTPSAPPPAPAATYAGAVTTTGRPPTPLERALGDAASGYVIAPYACEEVDSELLEFFLSDIDNERLVKIWRKRCTSGSDGSSRGRTFIVEMMKDISNDELSMTGENTIQSRIDLIVRSGLNEPSLQELYYMMDIHEAWTDALPLSTQPNDAKKAHIYQKWVCDLSPSIKVQMQVEMNSIESKALANGKNLRYEDPIGLVTQAATVVLQDEQNEAEIKGIESGRAFFSSKFDARKRPPSRTAPGGQTWAAPTSWQTGMRLCAMCPEGTAESARRHLDKDCSHATPAKLAARAKEIEEKRAKRKAEREKTKSGSANLAGGLALAEAIDGADAEAIKSIFPDDQEGPVILDLSSIMEGANARSLMVKGNAADATTTATATSISTALDQTDRLLASSKIFVVGYSGDDTVDSINPGIWIGQWSSDVLPAIVKLHLDNQLVLDEPGLKKRTGRVQSLEAAVSRCHKLSITPEYMGVIKLEGLNVGDNIENYLRLASGNASDGEPSLYEETSGEEDDDEPEPEVKATPSEHGPTNEPGTAADDLAVLFDDAPPSQPPSSATKFDNDLGSTAANITYAAPSPKTPLASSPLTMLTQQIEGITVNTHIDVIKDIIRTNNLPVSPSTGGSEARTKFEMINEMRDLIGSTPLPVEALLQRRRRPDPVPPVPMGIAITNTKPTATLVRRSGLPPAAKYLRDVHQYHLYFHDDGSVDGVTYAVQMDRNTGGRELDFDATEQSAKESQAAAHGSAETIVTPHSVAQLVYETIKFIVTTFVTIVRYFVMLMVTLIVSANMWVLFFAAYQPHLAPEFALDFTFCRRVAPAALCRLLAPGDNLTTNSMLDHAGGPAPPHGLTDGTQPSVEPGANDGSQGWPSWSCPSLAPSEALGLLLPSVICLILLLHSAFVTASYTYFASTLIMR